MNVAEIVTDRILSDLEQGIIPWHKPWVYPHGRASGAYSRCTGRPYSLLNQMLLGRPGEYVTFKQALDAGGSVRKGEKGSMVVFWKQQQVKDTDKDGKETVKTIPFLRYYTVFHIAQCDGLTPRFPAAIIDKPTFEPDAEAERIAQAYCARTGMRIESCPQNQAFYSPARDMVSMPEKAQFPKLSEYYSTLYHELTHSTGHKSRLNRFSDSGAAAAFGGTEYSKEELVAEIGAAASTFRLNLADADSEKNNTAYCQSWLKSLKNDKNMIVSASGKAEKAITLIFGDESNQPDGDGEEKPEAVQAPAPAPETAPEAPAEVPAEAAPEAPAKAQEGPAITGALSAVKALEAARKAIMEGAAGAALVSITELLKALETQAAKAELPKNKKSQYNAALKFAKECAKNKSMPKLAGAYMLGDKQALCNGFIGAMYDKPWDGLPQADLGKREPVDLEKVIDPCRLGDTVELPSLREMKARYALDKAKEGGKGWNHYTVVGECWMSTALIITAMELADVEGGPCLVGKSAASPVYIKGAGCEVVALPCRMEKDTTCTAWNK